jgi:hypothetical protein
MSNAFKFVKMNQFMVVKCGECYDRFSVVDTKEATHDWIPENLLTAKKTNPLSLMQNLKNSGITRIAQP